MTYCITYYIYWMISSPMKQPNWLSDSWPMTYYNITYDIYWMIS